jgi:hypothetical protein
LTVAQALVKKGCFALLLGLTDFGAEVAASFSVLLLAELFSDALTDVFVVLLLVSPRVSDVASLLLSAGEAADDDAGFATPLTWP